MPQCGILVLCDGATPIDPQVQYLFRPGGKYAEPDGTWKVEIVRDYLGGRRRLQGVILDFRTSWHSRINSQYYVAGEVITEKQAIRNGKVALDWFTEIPFGGFNVISTNQGDCFVRGEPSDNVLRFESTPYVNVNTKKITRPVEISTRNGVNDLVLKDEDYIGTFAIHPYLPRVSILIGDAIKPAVRPPPGFYDVTTYFWPRSSWVGFNTFTVQYVPIDRAKVGGGERGILQNYDYSEGKWIAGDVLHSNGDGVTDPLSMIQLRPGAANYDLINFAAWEASWPTVSGGSSAIGMPCDPSSWNRYEVVKSLVSGEFKYKEWAKYESGEYVLGQTVSFGVDGEPTHLVANDKYSYEADYSGDVYRLLMDELVCTVNEPHVIAYAGGDQPETGHEYSNMTRVVEEIQQLKINNEDFTSVRIKYTEEAQARYDYRGLWNGVTDSANSGEVNSHVQVERREILLVDDFLSIICYVEIAYEYSMHAVASASEEKPPGVPPVREESVSGADTLPDIPTPYLVVQCGNEVKRFELQLLSFDEYVRKQMIVHSPATWINLPAPGRGSRAMEICKAGLLYHHMTIYPYEYLERPTWGRASGRGDSPTRAAFTRAVLTPMGEIERVGLQYARDPKTGAAILFLKTRLQGNMCFAIDKSGIRQITDHAPDLVVERIKEVNPA